VHPAAPDVERRVDTVEVEPAEAEAAVGILESVEPAPGPRLEPGRLVLGRVDGLADALELSLDPLEACVGVVDVRLFRSQIRMSHASRLVTKSRAAKGAAMPRRHQPHIEEDPVQQQPKFTAREARLKVWLGRSAKHFGR
jgi:hypothetical protein